MRDTAVDARPAFQTMACSCRDGIHRQVAIAELLLCEHTVEILEALDFDRVPTRIEEEHGSLFARLSSETDDRRDVEGDAGALQSRGEFEPHVEGQDDAKVRHHYHVIPHLACAHDIERSAEMEGYLMSEKVEIHSGLGATPLSTTQDVTIERTSGIEIGHMVGEMEQALHRVAPCAFTEDTALATKANRILVTMVDIQLQPMAVELS